MKLDTTFASFLIKDKILEVTYKEGLHITYEIAEKIVSDRLSFTKGEKMAALIKSHGVISIDKAAREYFVSDAGIRDLKAAAIIVNSDYSRLLGNFFLIVNKTKMPVKIFSDIKKGAKWLQQYIN